MTKAQRQQLWPKCKEDHGSWNTAEVRWWEGSGPRLLVGIIASFAHHFNF
jgi:hypothetical protein